MRLLLDHKVNANAITQAGSTPLMMAVKNAHTDAAKVLLDGDADYEVCVLLLMHGPMCHRMATEGLEQSPSLACMCTSHKSYML